MWKIDSLSFEEFEHLKNNLLASMIQSLNKHNHDSFISLPHHVRFIDNLKKHQGLQEASASGLLVRVHLIQPFLFYSLNSLEPKFIEAYKQTWCKNNIFASLVNDQGEGNPRRFTCRLRLLQSSTTAALGYRSGRFRAVLLKGVPRDLQG